MACILIYTKTGATISIQYLRTGYSLTEKYSKLNMDIDYTNANAKFCQNKIIDEAINVVYINV